MALLELLISWQLLLYHVSSHLKMYCDRKMCKVLNQFCKSFNIYLPLASHARMDTNYLWSNGPFWGHNAYKYVFRLVAHIQERLSKHSLYYLLLHRKCAVAHRLFQLVPNCSQGAWLLLVLLHTMIFPVDHYNLANDTISPTFIFWHSTAREAFFWCRRVFLTVIRRNVSVTNLVSRSTRKK